jgi:hypothetical protein
MTDDTDTITIKPYWSTMSASRLHTHLQGLRYPEPLIRRVLRALQEGKAARRAKRIKQTVIFNLWDDLLRPARSELGVVRTLKSQLKRGDDALSGEAVAKHQALSMYEDALVETIATLRAVQKKDKLTPNQFAEQVREKSGLIIPNKGGHWTDYVDATDRRRITLLFNNLPDPKRGKKKVPFERHISPAENHEKRTALTARLVTEQETAEQEYDMAQHPQEKERLKNLLDQMQYAQYALDILPNNAPVPASWHGLLNK